MIGRDEVDLAGGERLPQALAIGPRPNGRRALERGRAVGDLLGGERQVVRTRLDRQRDAGRPRRANGRQRVGGRQVDDVDVRAELARQAHQQVDGGLLARIGPAVEPGRVATRIRRPSTAAIGSRSSAGSSACTSSGKPQSREDRQRLAKIGLVHVWRTRRHPTATGST